MLNKRRAPPIGAGAKTLNTVEKGGVVAREQRLPKRRHVGAFAVTVCGASGFAEERKNVGRPAAEGGEGIVVEGDIRPDGTLLASSINIPVKASGAMAISMASATTSARRRRMM